MEKAHLLHLHDKIDVQTDVVLLMTTVNYTDRSNFYLQVTVFIYCTMSFLSYLFIS
jgi:hypothetical protein